MVQRKEQYSDVSGFLRFNPLPPGDEDSIRPLFKEVFGHDISPALLHWKYGAGRGTSWVGSDKNGHLLVHCGLFFRKSIVGGRLQSVAQLVDLMASPRAHGGISRKQSPFYLLIKPLLKDLVAADNPGAWAFGFPSDRAMRLGEHLGVFRTIDRMYELSFTPRSPGYSAYRLVRLSALDGNGGRVLQRLWERMAADLHEGVVGVRDLDYLQQRYLNHPEKKYELYLVQSPWLRRQIGGFIINREGATIELMDIIAPLRNVPRIVQAAREWLYCNRVEQLKLWLASSHINLLADQASSVTPLEFRVMANPFTPVVELQRFNQCWWLTSGDTDYR